MGFLSDYEATIRPEAEPVAPQGEFSKGLRSGAYHLGANVANLVGGVAEKFDSGQDLSKQAYEQAQTYGQQAEANAPRVRSYHDIHGLRDAGDYFAGGMGGMVPILGGMAVGGAIGGIPGAALALAPNEAGDIVGRQRAAGRPVDLVEAGLGGVGSAALQTVLPAAIKGKFTNPLIAGAERSALAKESLGASIVKNTAIYPEQAGLMAGAEAIKQQAGEGKIDYGRVADAGMEGGIMAAPFHGAAVVGDRVASARARALEAPKAPMATNPPGKGQEAPTAPKYDPTDVSQAVGGIHEAMKDDGSRAEEQLQDPVTPLDKTPFNDPTVDPNEALAHDDRSRMQKATDMAKALWDKADELTAPQRTALTQAMQNLSDPANQATVAGVAAAKRAAATFASSVDSMHEAVSRAYDSVKGKDTDTMKSSDFSGMTKAIADHIAPIWEENNPDVASALNLNQRDGGYNAKLNKAADAVRKFVLVASQDKPIPADLAASLIDSFGPKTVTMLSTVRGMLHATDPMELENFAKNLADFKKINEGRMSTMQAMQENLLPEYDQSVTTRQLQNLRQHLLQHFTAAYDRSVGVDAKGTKADQPKSKTPAQDALVLQQIREGMQQYFGEGADKVYAAIEKEHTNETTRFEMDKVVRDEEGNELGTTKNRKSAEKEEADMFDAPEHIGDKDNMAMLSPEKAKGSGKYASATEQAMTKARERTPDRSVEFVGADDLGPRHPMIMARKKVLYEENIAAGMSQRAANAKANKDIKDYGVIESRATASHDLQISSDDLNSISLGKDTPSAHYEQPNIFKIGNRSFDAINLVKLMSAKLAKYGGFTETDNNAGKKDARAFMEGAASLMQRLGKKADFRDDLKINHEGLTYGDVKKMSFLPDRVKQADSIAERKQRETNEFADKWLAEAIDKATNGIVVDGRTVREPLTGEKLESRIEFLKGISEQMKSDPRHREIGGDPRMEGNGADTTESDWFAAQGKQDKDPFGNIHETFRHDGKNEDNPNGEFQTADEARNYVRTDITGEGRNKTAVGTGRNKAARTYREFIATREKLKMAAKDEDATSSERAAWEKFAKQHGLNPDLTANPPIVPDEMKSKVPTTPVFGQGDEPFTGKPAKYVESAEKKKSTGQDKIEQVEGKESFAKFKEHVKEMGDDELNDAAYDIKVHNEDDVFTPKEQVILDEAKARSEANRARHAEAAQEGAGEDPKAQQGQTSSGRIESRLDALNRKGKNTGWADNVAVGISEAANNGVSRDKVEHHPAIRALLAPVHALAWAGDKDAIAQLRRFEATLDQVYSLLDAKDTNAKLQTLLRTAASGHVPLHEALAIIYKSADVPEVYREIAKAADGAAGRGRVGMQDMERGTHGFFHPGAGTTHIGNEVHITHTVLHEAIHAATVRALIDKPHLQAAVYELMNHVAEHDDTLPHSYGFSTTLEFLSEGLSNEGFRERLMKIPASDKIREYLGDHIANAWQGLKELVMKALGLKPEQESAFTQLIELGGHAFKGTKDAGTLAGDHSVMRDRIIMSEGRAWTMMSEAAKAFSSKDASGWWDSRFADLANMGGITHSDALVYRAMLDRAEKDRTKQERTLKMAQAASATAEAAAATTKFAADKTGGRFGTKGAADSAGEFARERREALEEAKVGIFPQHASAEMLQKIYDEITEYNSKQYHSIPSEAGINRRMAMRTIFDAVLKSREAVNATLNGEGYKDVLGVKDIPTMAELTKGLQARIKNNIDAMYSKDTVGSRVSDEANRREAYNYLIKTFGGQIKVEWAKMPFAGEFYKVNGKDIVRLSTFALNPLSVAHHEALHGFFAKLRRDGAGKVTEALEQAAASPYVMKQIREHFAGNKEVLAQLDHPEERAAYMYQLWASGDVKFPTGPSTVFGQIKAFFNKMLGIWSNDQRAEHILNYLHSGEYGQDINSVRTVLNKTMEPGKNRTVEALKSYTKPLIEIGDTLLGVGHQRLRDTGVPALRQIADLVKLPIGSEGSDAGYLPASRAERTRVLNDLWAKIGSAPDEVTRAALEVLQDKNATVPAGLSGQVAEVVRAVRDTLDTQYKYLERNGVKVNDLGFGKDYFPRVWDIEYISRNQEAFLKMLQKYKDSGQFKGDPAAWMHKLISADGSEFRTEVNRPGMQFSKERIMGFISDEDHAKFAVKNLHAIVNSYVTQSTRRGEWAKRFGDDGAILNNLLAQATHDGATKRDMEVAERYIKAIDGTLGDSIDPTYRRLQGDMVVYQNTRLLPLAIFSSFIDPQGVLVRGGSVGDAWKTFKRGITGMANNFKGADELRNSLMNDKDYNMALAIGTIDDALMTRALGSSYTQGMTGSLASTINHTFFRYNLMEQYNIDMRVGATQAAINFLTTHGEGKATAHSERWMRELGFEPGEIKKGADGRILTSEADGLTTMEANKVRMAINRWVDGAVLRPDAADKPIWMSDPHYVLFAHLKQFVFSFQEVLLKRIVHEYKNGNYTPAMAMASYVPVMIASDLAKGLIMGGGSQPGWKDDWGPLDYINNGIERSGIHGTRQFGIDAFHDIRHGGSGVGVLAGPTVQQLGSALKTIAGRESPSSFVKDALPAHALYAGFWGRGDVGKDPTFVN